LDSDETILDIIENLHKIKSNKLSLRINALTFSRLKEILATLRAQQNRTIHHLALWNTALEFYGVHIFKPDTNSFHSDNVRSHDSNAK